MAIPILTASLGTTATLAMAGYMWMRRRPAKREAHHIFRCVRCGQKVRYLASKVGQQGMCPRCGKNCVLPPPGQEDDIGQTAKMRIRIGRLTPVMVRKTG